MVSARIRRLPTRISARRAPIILCQVAPQNLCPSGLRVRPEDGSGQHVDTCFSTHHLYFAKDANRTLWLSAGGPASGVVGWVNTKLFLETGDSAKSQGWTPIIVDTNGNGRRDEGDTG